jgi:hypothetical protein
MKVFKRTLVYLYWIVLSLLSGIGYMRIVLGAKPKSSTGIFKMFDWTYDVALFQVGLIIGGIIALLYILFDVFYLKKKLENNLKSTISRFLILLIIATVVGTTHYILEKIIDFI